MVRKRAERQDRFGLYGRAFRATYRVCGWPPFHAGAAAAPAAGSWDGPGRWSAVAGVLAARTGIQQALLCAGVGIAATTALGLVARLPNATTDVSPWNHWRMPALVNDLRPDLDAGPVLVTLEYRLDHQPSEDFLEAIHEYGRIRRRDGAVNWAVYQDPGQKGRYVESFVVESWAEHMRQHERATVADRDIDERARSFVSDPDGVVVAHLVAARPPDDPDPVTLGV